MKKYINLIEPNEGAWVIYGIIGIHRYYNFHKQDAIDLYLKECEKTFENKKRKRAKKDDRVQG